ncbi:benzaldehyde dehydrogenase [Streptomyces cinnamoneus]|uniref:Benzaldehyde dehydrogenase n=1 Tax=Streptomyces cinnamoneus TaxID=53446 RepID=A0A2G1XPR8_STRCJ|nr:aldehyde dehydrogenase family protein [Streptomyces cinnamoneus]PHQ53216.1 benzaldehyde dehydrogenase [Streptomyces cinnamoneus]PPT12307.1 benzaldehyde dehydrogenase [Streptomyces cinnamoneus]
MTRLVDPAGLRGKVYGDGWRTTAAGTADTVEPATGATLATVGLAGAAEVRAAAASAARAQPGWAATPPAERAELMRAAARLLEEHRAEVVEWIVREGGAVVPKAEAEVDAVLDELWVAASLHTQPHGHLLPSVPGRHSVARRLPLGVVGVISPWNFPLLLGMRAVAPALALGNAVVLKPDLHTPVSGGLVVARLFEEAGLPAGVLHVLPGGAEAGAALTESPDTAMIAFTGSTAVGRLIGETAGRALKRVSLELGGNNALIVLDDADPGTAASAGAFGAFFHQGQVCMTAGRHIVLERVADAYVEHLTRRAERLSTGDPWTAKPDLGPLVDAAQRERVERIVRESVAAGARVRTGGTGEGPFYRPTVLTGVTPRMPAFTEEIFGPVAPVVVVPDVETAVAVANDCAYGLTAGVLTGSPERGLAVAERLGTGIVHVNDQTIGDDAVVPFGGRGASGNGSRHGVLHSWDEFTQWQWMTVQGAVPAYPF